MTVYGGGYPGQPAATPGPGSGGLAGLLARLGDRVVRRPQPRLGIALAGVGTIMVVLGVIALGGDSSGDGGDGEVNRTVGVLLSMLVIAAGYLLLVRFRGGPLATAGVVAAALGVPMMLIFATVDAEVDETSEVFLELPISIDAVALLSLAAWLATYLWVPVARGRTLFLGLSTFTLWLYLLDKVEEGAAGYVLTLPFSLGVYALESAFESDAPELPDPGTVGGLSLVVGLVYYLIAYVADRQRRRGLAMPFLAAGFVCTALGVAHMAGDLEAIGTGIVLIVLGSALGLYGATQERRFTTWVWAAAAGLGIMVIVIDASEDSLTGFGVAAMVAGAAVVLVAHLVATWFDEPDEMASGGSRFTPRRPRPAPAAAAPGAWPPPGQPTGGPTGPADPAGAWGPPAQPSPPPQPAPPAPPPPPEPVPPEPASAAPTSPIAPVPPAAPPTGPPEKP